ncbi:helix-turn-helix domain-containing protein [Streptomyces iconiensis]|uniref:Helix-turn-helix transcriptional regulator n=1 Tax=Streptomyces iconiensis TaxID=1384038 RepID=A0ABT6ZRR9_9ACTN|nr:helix-turn-helix transcriptional regulator [Streptomyces iconiensis]MDJ1131763.1 helix-turn-helix transcriptional regulator [Streptomyces iconiensis]
MSPDDLRRISAIRMAAASGEARDKRRELRLTLKEVAAAVGASPSSLHRWEHGQTTPRGALAVRWAKVLGIKTKVS